MAFYGCLLGGGVIWPLLAGRNPTRGKVFAASVIGNIIALQLGAFSVTLQTLASNVTELPFGAFVAMMQPIHFVIGTIEGVITGSVLCFIYNQRPEMLMTGRRNSALPQLSRKSMLAAIAVMSFVVAGFLSLVASSSPDGLEWSVEKLPPLQLSKGLTASTLKLQKFRRKRQFFLIIRCRIQMRQALAFFPVLSARVLFL
jgi:cobalt/nickel transport system permease protein